MLGNRKATTGIQNMLGIPTPPPPTLYFFSWLVCPKKRRRHDNYARTGLPVNTIPNPTPLNRRASELHDTASVIFTKDGSFNINLKNLPWKTKIIYQVNDSVSAPSFVWKYFQVPSKVSSVKPWQGKAISVSGQRHGTGSHGNCA